jgi:secreted PhoX family phosphatase
MALFTASLKIGAMELNRAEDLEWNPQDPSGSPRLYVAFTNHNRRVALNQDGVKYDPATHATTSQVRPDTLGAIFAMKEADSANPGTSTTFDFYGVWSGTSGSGAFDAANPDNILIDAQGGVWFGTDGNFGTNGHADALYYLDLDPTHQTTTTPTFGKAFRIAAAPSDAEATGPAFSSGMTTLFFSVQHPGEDADSSWPPR